MRIPSAFHSYFHKLKPVIVEIFNLQPLITINDNLPCNKIQFFNAVFVSFQFFRAAQHLNLPSCR